MSKNFDIKDAAKIVCPLPYHPRPEWYLFCEAIDEAGDEADAILSAYMAGDDFELGRLIRARVDAYRKYKGSDQ